MKLSKFIAAFYLAVLLFTIGCKQDLVKELQTPDALPEMNSAKPSGSGSATCADYQVALDVSYADGKSYFIWTITNPRPGNGTNGTLQNLSHWNFVAGACADANLGIEQNWSDVLQADFKYNLADAWTEIVPTPIIQPDPSQKCHTANVFKFNQGTNGSNATYYRLVLEGRYGKANTTAIFKSGSNTGCCQKQIEGIGCKEDQFCSLSQGYYFAKPGPTWPAPGTVIVGGKVYTEAEGRAIWQTSNAGGIRDSKKGFTQASALKLSGANYPLSVLADIAIIDNWLATKAKLTASPLYLPNQTAGEIALYGNVAEAGGRIGDWINDNHCAN